LRGEEGRGNQGFSSISHSIDSSGKKNWIEAGRKKRGEGEGGSPRSTGEKDWRNHSARKSSASKKKKGKTEGARCPAVGPPPKKKKKREQGCRRLSFRTPGREKGKAPRASNRLIGGGRGVDGLTTSDKQRVRVRIRSQGKKNKKREKVPCTALGLAERKKTRLTESVLQIGKESYLDQAEAKAEATGAGRKQRAGSLPKRKRGETRQACLYRQEKGTGEKKGKKAGGGRPCVSKKKKERK